MELNPKYQIDYKVWLAFEDLYCFVKGVMSRYQSSSQETHHNTSSFVKPKVKLPPIELLSFNGDVKKWPLFYAQFKSMIHDNASLSNSEKVFYLIGKLCDKATSVCAGLPATGDNYSLIWNALIQKYDDPRSLASTYLNQMLDFKPLNNNSAAGLDSFLNNFISSVDALKQLKLNDLLDFILLHLALQKLDQETVKLFEITYRKEQVPSYNDLVQFLKEQTKVLTRTTSSSKGKISKSFLVDNKSNSHFNCILCKQSPHKHLFQCDSFIKRTPKDRYSFIKNNSYCHNCLSTNHKTSACTSIHNCNYCGSRHHSLLHFNTQDKKQCNISTNLNCHQSPTNSAAPVSTCEAQSSSARATATQSRDCYVRSRDLNQLPQTNVIENQTSFCSVSRDQQLNSNLNSITLLGTAKINVYDNNNRLHSLRCLVDSGSQSEYISLECCKRLSLFISKEHRFKEVQGIGGSAQKIHGTTAVRFTSRHNSKPVYDIRPLVVEKITSQLPEVQVNTSTFSHLINKLELADNDFFKPGPIDLLLGVNVFCKILLQNKIVNSNNIPSFLQTTLGYIIMGDAPIDYQNNFVSRAFCSFTSEPLDGALEKFWTVEELPERKFLSPDEKECENIYSSTTTRNDDGSFTVSLPFKESPDKLGNSYVTAKRRFELLEKRFARSPELQVKYNEAIRDYISQNILNKVSEDNISSSGFYLPHHPVVREDKTTTRLRIVLDGSAKTDSNLSLNDILHSGCNLQTEIFHVLLNVRIYPIAFLADVRQMYLCIFVHPEHRKFQRILYRFSQNEKLATYEFTRVTFGLRSSPFLALRTLRELARLEGNNFPLATSILERDIYMDDIASSASSLKEAVDTATHLIKLFKSGGFDLVKWTSNSLEFLQHIPVSHRHSESISFETDDVFKILGLRWLPSTDTFYFVISQPPPHCTKRTILSVTARLYDVLGLVGPVILYAKLLMKELWLLKISWDESPPIHIVDMWKTYISELPLISTLRFPRHLGIRKDSRVSLLAFSDASEKAYGCVIYLHVQNDSEEPIVSLVSSKSRVSSPSRIVTLARLELSSLVLLAKLVRSVYDSISNRHPIDNIYIFSDSVVALCWISSSPHRFNTYVANRISQFQTLMSTDNLYHIAGAENPADFISRGLRPSEIINNDLWLSGPPWATASVNEWPIKKFSRNANKDLPESKTVNHLAKICTTKNPLFLLSTKFSSWMKFLRSTVYVLRFLKLLPRNNTITANDLVFAELAVIKTVQQYYFEPDIQSINKSNNCSTSLRKLSPFILDNILRVGGRLKNSALDFSHKHPILLPKKEHIVDLIIDFYHKENCHAGPQLLLSIIRQRFWICSGLRAIKKRIRLCVKCFRFKPKQIFPMMADLPRYRVDEPIKAFTHTGIDNAGPLYITLTRKRGIRSQKAYLCIFICLVTRAVHFELASDLSSTTFLNAFRRFLSRRGPCQFVYSDNGTNFVAAKTYLNELYSFLASDKYYKDFTDELAKNRITWNMIPPLASHFGGIWESNIKSVKSLLFRCIGKQILTFEEMYTVLNQIEAVLNSRPLSLLSTDPADPTALTPAHFLHTVPLKFLPSPNIDLDTISLSNRFSLMNTLVKSFWNRFKLEYLHSLQMRSKWNTSSNSPAVGMIVLINVENSPPLHWPLGIITKLFPGNDGVARVAEVKTSTKTYRRPIVKLSPLPVQ